MEKNKTQYKPSSATLSGGNVYIDNSIFMEFVDEIATKMTEIAYKGENVYAPSSEAGQEDDMMFQEEPQDYYNERYDEVETMLNRTLNIHSDNDSEL